MKKSLRFFRQVFSLGVLATLLQITTLAQVTNGTVVITRPSDGASFALGEPILITADAYDAQGYMPRVEFYETNVLIGVSTLNFLPAPAITPVQHSMIWSNALPGIHTVRALGIGSTGNKTYSEPVHIRVLPKTNQTVVRIVATDPEATEFFGPLPAIDPAIFTIFREGPTNNPLTVFLSFHGTAQFGFDYQVFPFTNATGPLVPITIPAGQTAFNLPVTPITGIGSYNEPMETVGIHLEYSPVAGPQADYIVDPDYREAAAVIYEQSRPANGALEIA
ncbi:MAG: Ig-like domain-containing protein, partial [Verrucomicrobiota bacterium]